MTNPPSFEPTFEPTEEPSIEPTTTAVTTETADVEVVPDTTNTTASLFAIEFITEVLNEPSTTIQHIDATSRQNTLVFTAVTGLAVFVLLCVFLCWISIVCHFKKKEQNAKEGQIHRSSDGSANKDILDELFKLASISSHSDQPPNRDRDEPQQAAPTLHSPQHPVRETDVQQIHPLSTEAVVHVFDAMGPPPESSNHAEILYEPPGPPKRVKSSTDEVQMMNMNDGGNSNEAQPVIDEEKFALREQIFSENYDEKQAVQIWLLATVKLPQYVDMFIDEGYDHMLAVQTLTDGELQEMGITKRGHRKRILVFVEQYKQQRDREQQRMTNINESVVPRPHKNGTLNTWEGVDVVDVAVVELGHADAKIVNANVWDTAQ